MAFSGKISIIFIALFVTMVLSSCFVGFYLTASLQKLNLTLHALAKLLILRRRIFGLQVMLEVSFYDCHLQELLRDCLVWA